MSIPNDYVRFDWGRLAAVYRTMEKKADPYTNLIFSQSHFFYWENRYETLRQEKDVNVYAEMVKEAEKYMLQWRDHVYRWADIISEANPDCNFSPLSETPNLPQHDLDKPPSAKP